VVAAASGDSEAIALAAADLAAVIDSVAVASVAEAALADSAAAAGDSGADAKLRS
jgi:hypothetical protein